jgi:hypothetical protein
MKINEITNKQLDEGVLDNLKAGFKGIGQGAQTGQPNQAQPSKPGVLGKIGQSAMKGAQAVGNMAVKGAQAAGIGSAIKGGQNVLGKIGSAIKGAGAGYQAQKAVGQQQAVNKQTLFKTQQAYNNWAAQIKAAGQEPTAEQATAWFKQMFGTDPATPLSGTNPAQIQQWLTKEIPAYMANKATGGETAPTAPTVQPAQSNPPANITPLPDINKLTRDQLVQLKQQLQAV